MLERAHVLTGTSGIVNSVGNMTLMEQPLCSAFVKVIENVKVLYSKTLELDDEKVFIVMTPVVPMTVSPVVIDSIM